jgi:hypothetical protein
MFDKFNAAVLLTSAPPLGQKSARSFAAPNDNLHWPVFTVHPLYQENVVASVSSPGGLAQAAQA